MWYEISQYEIPNRQLLATNRKPGADRWTDIGEVKITHTIFGRAKVCVIREQDKKRRAWVLMAMALSVAAMAAAIWQWWIPLHQTGLPLSATPPLLSNEEVRISAPEFQLEYLPASATLPPVGNKPITQPQTGINTPVDSREAAPQQLPKASGPLAAKPVAPQPLPTSKPQPAPLATSNSPAQIQTGIQQPPKPSAPITPVVQTIATHPATQPAVSKPAAIAPPVEPLKEKDTSTEAPAGDGNQPPETAQEQP